MALGVSRISGFWALTSAAFGGAGGFLTAGIWANLMIGSRFFRGGFAGAARLLLVVAPEVDDLGLSSLRPAFLPRRLALDFHRRRRRFLGRGPPSAPLCAPGASVPPPAPPAAPCSAPGGPGLLRARQHGLDDRLLGRRDFDDFRRLFDGGFGGRLGFRPGQRPPAGHIQDLDLAADGGRQVVFAAIDFRRLPPPGSAGRSPPRPSCRRRAGRRSLSRLLHRSDSPAQTPSR